MYPLYLASTESVLSLMQDPERPGYTPEIGPSVMIQGRAVILRVVGANCYVHASADFEAPEDWTVVLPNVNTRAQWRAEKDTPHGQVLLKKRVLRQGADFPERKKVWKDEIEEPEVVEATDLRPHHWTDALTEEENDG
jgi:hypothetical protein